MGKTRLLLFPQADSVLLLLLVFGIDIKCRIYLQVLLREELGPCLPDKKQQENAEQLLSVQSHALVSLITRVVWPHST